jgi:hypothetical protein
MSVVMVIQNDYFSYDKEYVAWRADGEKHPFVNGVRLILRNIESHDLQEAKEIVKKEMEWHEKRYVELRDKLIEKRDATPRIRKYFDIMELAVAGLQIWSMSSPRYFESAQDENLYPELLRAVQSG